MCVIVDINVAARVLLRDDDSDFEPVSSYLDDKNQNGLMVYGGKLATEYLASAKLARRVAELDRAGRARAVPHEQVEVETQYLQDNGLCVSNDEHIIALARVSGVRLVCTLDQDLHTDVTDKKLLSSPRGKVYQYASHKSLLTTHCRRVSRR